MLTRFTLIFLLWLAACTPRPTQESNPSIPSGTEELSPPMPLFTTPDPQRERMSNIAVKDLSNRLSIDYEMIHVISIESIIWPNAALGCPRPGKVYAQGTVPGFRIQLVAEGLEYLYHTDQVGQIILCVTKNTGDGELPEFPVTPGEIDDGQPWMPMN